MTSLSKKLAKNKKLVTPTNTTKITQPKKKKVDLHLGVGISGHFCPVGSTWMSLVVSKPKNDKLYSLSRFVAQHKAYLINPMPVADSIRKESEYIISHRISAEDIDRRLDDNQTMDQIYADTMIYLLFYLHKMWEHLELKYEWNPTKIFVGEDCQAELELCLTNILRKIPGVEMEVNPDHFLVLASKMFTQARRKDELEVIEHTLVYDDKIANEPLVEDEENDDFDESLFYQDRKPNIILGTGEFDDPITMKAVGKFMKDGVFTEDTPNFIRTHWTKAPEIKPNEL